MESDGGVHKVGFTVSVEVIHGHCVGNVRTEVGILCVSKGALSRCSHERDIFSISIHHGDGINVPVAAKVSDVEVCRTDKTELNDGWICGLSRNVGRIGSGRSSDARAGIFHNGYVVRIAGVSD